jgi:hypothetical protein
VGSERIAMIELFDFLLNYYAALQVQLGQQGQCVNHESRISKASDDKHND